MTSPTILDEQRFMANHYHPLPVVLVKGKGVYVWDENGKQYLDCMSGYSALSHGHCHPKLLEALTEQAQKLTFTSRAFYHDKLGAFLNYCCELTGQDKALPMNTGAEAVETAIKAARKWAYTIKGVSENQADIIVCNGNFHGRTTTIIGFSSEPQYRAHFGPFAPGFVCIPYGDPHALEQAITQNTAAFLVEPIQGEAGIILPPAGYLKICETICRKHNVLLICDEIQTGLGRTGKFLACQHEQVKPDGLLLGKALGGSFLPVSMFLSKKEVMDVFTPGDHGSTFGGNPLASVIGLTALQIIIDENLVEQSAILGDYLLSELNKIKSTVIKEIRGKGLFIGVEINPASYVHAREICLRLLEKGILAKEAHQTVIRLVPPLIVTKEQLDELVNKFTEVVRETK